MKRMDTQKPALKLYFSFHLVDFRPWPVISALRIFVITAGLVKWFHFHCADLLILGILSTALARIQWWRDISREATLQGHHTIIVENGIRLGIILFILSEVIFFLSFFWAFFHSSLSPVHQIGRIWPPSGVTPLDPMAAPFLNTILLLASGVTVTWTHFRLLAKDLFSAKLRLIITVFLGLYFSRVQFWEYTQTAFSMSDSIYGSTFFISTGFHGLHIIVGSLFLLVCLYRLIAFQFSASHHFGFEAAAWYWHFVDVVWLFLFSFIYWWGK